MGSINAAVLPAKVQVTHTHTHTHAHTHTHTHTRTHTHTHTHTQHTVRIRGWDASCYATPTSSSGCTGAYVFAHKSNRIVLACIGVGEVKTKPIYSLQERSGKVHIREIHVRDLRDGLIKECAFILLHEHKGIFDLPIQDHTTNRFPFFGHFVIRVIHVLLPIFISSPS